MPVMREIAKYATKRFFGQIWDDFLGYMRVYEYIKLKTARLTGKSITVPSVASFWFSILGDKYGGDRHTKYIELRNGDVLKFRDVFLADWAPKIPGKSWTLDGVEAYSDARQHFDGYLEVNQKFYAVLLPGAKKEVVAAGYGSIRIARRTRDTNHYMYMSLVDKDKWHCDLGIPVVVSKQVYEQFYRHAAHGSPWLRKIEGVLHLDEDLPFAQLVPEAIGSLLSPEAESTLRYRAGIPRCYLHVVSPLSVSPTYNDSHPTATAWTQFQCTRQSREPYRYTYTMCDPSSHESMEAAVAFIQRYVKQYDGTRIITDFDGQRPRLEAAIPLRVSTIRSSKSRKEVALLVKNYNRWISEKLSRMNYY